MNSLATRRLLLVAEAELHRVTLADDWDRLSSHAGTFRERAKAGARTAAGWAAAGIALRGGLRLLFGGGRTAGFRRPPGPVRRLFGVAQTGLSLWFALRPLFSRRFNRPVGQSTAPLQRRPAAR